MQVLGSAQIKSDFEKLEGSDRCLLVAHSILYAYALWASAILFCKMRYTVISQTVGCTSALAFKIKRSHGRISVTGVLCACEVPSFICACVHAGILLVSSLAGLVSAGLSIGQVDLWVHTDIKFCRFRRTTAVRALNYFPRHHSHLILL